MSKLMNMLKTPAVTKESLQSDSARCKSFLLRGLAIGGIHRSRVTGLISPDDKGRYGGKSKKINPIKK
jgi:hypothetical protein